MRGAPTARGRGAGPYGTGPANSANVLVAQPAEETGEGVGLPDDGLHERFPLPDVLPAQHISAGPIGQVAHVAGPVASASIDLVVHGRGGHGSRPDTTRIPSSSAPRSSVGCNPSSPARSRPVRRPSSRSAASTPAPLATSSPQRPNSDSPCDQPPANSRRVRDSFRDLRRVRLRAASRVVSSKLRWSTRKWPLPHRPSVSRERKTRGVDRSRHGLEPVPQSLQSASEACWVWVSGLSGLASSMSSDSTCRRVPTAVGGQPDSDC